MPQIHVHEKALAHLSRGLYRSPASALRELVSNAWDAQASAVRIGTNCPNFLQLSVEDDGVGFTKRDFEQLMAGGIGNSQKRVGDAEASGRPVIGRLGIGMLGIAQLCGAFTLVSRPLKGEGFRARITLYDLLKDKLDKGDSSVVKTTGTTESPISIVDVGEYEFETFDPKAIRHGTRLIADDLHPTFVQSFQESTRKSEPVPMNWGDAVKIISGKSSLQELGDYWRLLWELAAAAPVPYLSATSLPQSLARADQQRLESYKFRVVVDGIELRKPVALRGNEAGYSAWPIEPQERTLYGKRLRFHGYILVQEGTQLKPDELRGIMIRIKDVGIGYYDPSLLDYRFNEGPRTKWVTGEVFVDEGLEDALNLDRESFNRFHPHFRALQEYVRTLLHDEVFPQTYREIEKRSKARRTERDGTRRTLLKTVLTEAVGKPVSIRTADAGDGDESPRVGIQPRAGRLQVELPEDVPTKRSNQLLAKSVLALFELALREKDRERQRTQFAELLMRLLSKW